MTLKITWYDNAAFSVDTGDGVLWFDPSVNKNDDSPIKVDDINEPATFVFTTHGDPGHFVNSVEITQKTGARFVGSEDLCDFILQNSQLPKEKLIPLNFGETKTIDGFKVHLFQATHPEITPEIREIIHKWGGVETRNGGLVVQGKKFSICILGDCIYSEVFKEIGQKFRVDIGMIPIQGRKHVDSTPEEAAETPKSAQTADPVTAPAAVLLLIVSWGEAPICCCAYCRHVTSSAWNRSKGLPGAGITATVGPVGTVAHPAATRRTRESRRFRFRINIVITPCPWVAPE